MELKQLNCTKNVENIKEKYSMNGEIVFSYGNKLNRNNNKV